MFVLASTVTLVTLATPAWNVVAKLVVPALPYAGLLLLVGFTVLLVRPRRFVRHTKDGALRALLRQVHGDRAIATRLARFELERAPDLTDEQAIERAHRKLTRERR